MKKGDKIKLILFLTPVALAFMSMWFIILYNVDYSDENFKRDNYQYRLESYKYQKALCEIFGNKFISGKVIKYKSPFGAGSSDILIIEIDKTSDIYGMKYDCNNIKDRDFKLQNNILEMYLTRAPNRPKTFKIGATVKKERNSDYIEFTTNNNTSKLKFYYLYEYHYNSCTDLDTMNIIWNYKQYLKYDKLSRRHIELNDYAKKIVKECIDNQTQKK